MYVNILGTDYEITTKRYDEDPTFAKNGWDAYCDDEFHRIVLGDLHTFPDWEDEPADGLALLRKETLRHETVHAFFNESGLKQNSVGVDSWAKNEEMVDWIAIQGPKLYEVWRKIGAI